MEMNLFRFYSLLASMTMVVYGGSPPSARKVRIHKFVYLLIKGDIYKEQVELRIRRTLWKSHFTYFHFFMSSLQLQLHT